MARLGQTFYVGQYANSADMSFEPVPAGTYEVQVTDADLKTTQKGDGQYISMELSIVRNPEYQGRKIFANITVSNPSQKAVDIGRAQIMDLCEILSFSSGFNDTDQLKGRTFGVKVKVSDGTPERPNKRNDVTQYLYPDGHQPGKGPQQPSHQPEAAAPVSDASRAPLKRPF